MGLGSKLSRWIKLWKHQFSIKGIENRKCEDNDSVLIIKLDAIGDFLIWLDSAKEYKGLFPGKRCVLLCNALCREIAEATGYFDEVMTLSIQKFETDETYQKEQLRALSERKFGVLIQTAYSRTQHMDLMAAAIPAKKKIGFEADDSKSNISRSLISKKNRERLDAIYDQLIHSSKETLMELQRNKELIVGLGGENFRSAMPRLPHIEGVELPEKPYFLVFPGASTPIKMWRPEYFAEVIDYVHENTDWNCLICGSAQEKHLFERIHSLVRFKDRTEDYCGKASILELIEIVRIAELVISNDTSGIHFAAATGVTGICPLGEYNYGRFLPYGSDEGGGTVHVCSAGMKCKNCADGHMTARCLLHIMQTGRYQCLDRVSAKDVIKELAGCIR